MNSLPPPCYPVKAMHCAVILLFCLLSAINLSAQTNAPPVITLLSISETANPDELLLTYDLSDEEMDDSEVFLRAGTGNYFQIAPDPATLSGDIGLGIAPGTGKQIVWNYAGQLQPGTFYQIKIVADDHQVKDIQEIVDQVDSTILLQNLQFIEGIRHPTAGAAHLAEVQDSLYQLFVQNTDLAEILEFDFNNYTAKNIVGNQVGLTDNAEVIYLTAHYDSINNTPGADDNATGVVYVMEALRLLSECQFKKTIRYIGFDVEEEGLVGSINYVQNHLPEEETVIGVLNSDGIGYYDDSPNSQDLPFGFDLLFPDAYAEVASDDFRGNFITNIGNEEHVPLKEAFDNAAATYVPELRVISLEAPNNCALVPDLCRSDHAPFWIAGEPAIFLSDGADFRNPHYHTSHDTIGTLNMTFFTQVVKALVATVLELGELQHGSFDVADYPVGVSEVDCTPQITQQWSSEKVYIALSDCEATPLGVALFDSSGKLIGRHKWPAGQKSYSIQTGGLSTGIYILKLRFAEGVVARRVWVR